MSLSEKIKSYALEAGADLVGIAQAFVGDEAKENLEEFVEEGRQGEMKYLENTTARVHPEMVLAGAKSVIVIGLNYGRGDGVEETAGGEGGHLQSHAQPAAARTGTAVPSSANAAASRGYGKIARYAYGRDYHKVLGAVLKKICAQIKKIHPEGNLRACVDSAPLLEKNYAVEAGLGFIGKNTTLITKEFGSFVVLGEILTDFALDYDKPAGGGTGGQAPGTCGTCTRCLEACPTKALIAPKKMDARRCISYLTIEKRGEIAPELASKIGNRIFGCDICQEVCPYNLALAQPGCTRPAKNPDFNKAIAGNRLNLKEILAIKDDEAYQAKFAGSPLMRAKREGLKRNARIAMDNEGGNPQG